MTGRIIQLTQAWEVGELISGGGFGQVYRARSGKQVAALKLVPKDAGADRELLFADLGSARNVVPTIDSGETDEHWVIVMPLAKKTLRAWLDEADAAMAVADAVLVLGDVAVGLSDLSGVAVHRDLKPENILLLDGHWCLADFGIARYAEATTAPDTRKHAMTPPYAAPEQWRAERATSATDVYALGVIAYELLTGTRPFAGPTLEDFREQHLHEDAPPLADVPKPLASLIEECLLKAPAARPSAENILGRLERMSFAASSPGLAQLQQANHAEVQRLAEAHRSESVARSKTQEREELASAAMRILLRISEELRDALTVAAPTAVLKSTKKGWDLTLGTAELELAKPVSTVASPWDGWQAPAFTVIAHSHLSLRIPRDRYEYEGRSHSLWYCDAQEAGRFGWYETAFMVTPLIAQRGRQDPFALDPGEESAKAVWNGMAEFQVAWPFTPLVPGELGDFIDRWANWLAAASNKQLSHPSHMPERDTNGSWRRS